MAEATTTTVRARPTTAFFQPNVCSMLIPPQEQQPSPEFLGSDAFETDYRIGLV
jgi:hypothetical protein